jgi:hypothetical protein
MKIAGGQWIRNRYFRAIVNRNWCFFAAQKTEGGEARVIDLFYMGTVKITNYYSTPPNNVSSLLPYHNHVDPDIVVGAVNTMIDEINDSTLKSE